MQSQLTLMPRGEYWGRTIDSTSHDGVLLTLVHYEQGVAPLHVHEQAGLFFLMSGQHKQSSSADQFCQPPFSGIWHGTSYAHETEIGPEGMLGLNISLNTAFCEKIELQDQEWSRAPSVHHSLTLAGLRLARATQSQLCSADVCNLVLEAISCLEPRQTPLCKRVKRIRSRIEAEFTEQIRITDLAVDEGLHPVYLARAFRKGFGCTMTEYLQRRRLVGALTLVQEGSSIGEAAAASGFADQPHLNRICRKHLGVSPGKLKKDFFPCEV